MPVRVSLNPRSLISPARMWVVLSISISVSSSSPHTHSDKRHAGGKIPHFLLIVSLIAAFILRRDRRKRAHCLLARRLCARLLIEAVLPEASSLLTMYIIYVCVCERETPALKKRHGEIDG